MRDLSSSIIVRHLGVCPYSAIWEEMKRFTQNRTETTSDELWVLEHEPVFTQGQAGKPEHVRKISEIPILQSDRGGQVTYHGPGQLIVYTLIDLRRKNLNIRTFTRTLENAVLLLLQKEYGISANTQEGAPGVYIQGAKIASLGLRIRRGCSYHGLSLNVAMDLKPFGYINPCGLPGLEITHLHALRKAVPLKEVVPKLTSHLTTLLGYTMIIEE